MWTPVTSNRQRRIVTSGYRAGISRNFRLLHVNSWTYRNFYIKFRWTYIDIQFTFDGCTANYRHFRLLHVKLPYLPNILVIWSKDTVTVRGLFFTSGYRAGITCHFRLLYVNCRTFLWHSGNFKWTNGDVQFTSGYRAGINSHFRILYVNSTTSGNFQQNLLHFLLVIATF